MFLARSSLCPLSFPWNLFSGTWAELRSPEIPKENFADVRSVGSENIVQRVLKGGSEICDELTKLVSTAVSTNQIEAFGTKTAKTLKIFGIGDSGECDWKFEENVSCDQISKSQISGASDLPPSPWGTLPGKNILESCFQTSDQRMLAECRVVEFLGAIFQSSQFYGGKAAW